jgi:hypothetical protein
MVLIRKNHSLPSADVREVVTRGMKDLNIVRIKI